MAQILQTICWSKNETFDYRMFHLKKGKQGGLAGGFRSMEQQSRIPADREVKDVKTDSKYRRISDDR